MTFHMYDTYYASYASISQWLMTHTMHHMPASANDLETFHMYDTQHYYASYASSSQWLGDLSHVWHTINDLSYVWHILCIICQHQQMTWRPFWAADDGNLNMFKKQKNCYKKFFYTKFQHVSRWMTVQILLYRYMYDTYREIVVYWYSFSNPCTMCIHCGFSLVGIAIYPYVWHVGMTVQILL